jgi:putative transposase
MRKRWVRGHFNWQEGFGAFSYSKSHVDRVCKYILDQERHHQKQTFKHEYVGLLDKFEVDYEDRFLFDWIE